MALASTSVHVIEQASQNSCCLYHFCLLPLQEAFQDQQVDLTQAPFKLLLLPWVLECVRFCVCPLRVKSLISHSPLALLKISPTDLQSQMFWVFIFPVQDSRAGEPTLGLGLLALWEQPLQL